MIVLGLETSCDETAVGVVDRARPAGSRILAQCVATQFEEHRPYGGVVPEIAARAHLDKMDMLVENALVQAGLSFDQIDGIAATCGPGLIGGVMVGAMTGKALAAVSGKPFIAVNHLEAHALTVRLMHDVAFPYLLMLMSGGHCQILLVNGVGQYQQLGTTLDDAVGECFDKSAKLLGLGYPGGPLLEKAAQKGRAHSHDLPRPLCGRAGCDFSFSGLKTAVRQKVEQQAHPLSESFVADMAASLQHTIADILEDRARQAFAMIEAPVTALVVGGGVAANTAIRERLTQTAASQGLSFLAPPVSLCTDNGVMIAWAGAERLALGLTDDLSFRARPRWPLAELSKETGA
ncbi:MAG: tRNA (adenosine(37)-N6)-threonylcarbamoyltransferase complex transferase subunit TsaD [Proteobacteria bacterium]|nr:tRNA (adenosine(37)-N6)-threonylcarbamoyltransferase complex transferase subunit TsaD [Alphaproteobacteria bacterium]NCC04011.1 tRNA (adenosine(37)-N6)-threonylcarbamoyltransferase complex transferase subunit TsaD [Pseudomonadota bacterium]